MIVIKLPFKLPSVNNIYWHRGNIKILKTTGRELRNKIIKEVLNQVPEQEARGYVGKKLAYRVEVFDDWYFKNGNIKKRDIINVEKFLTDSIILALKTYSKEFDDMYIWDNTLSKRGLNEKENIHVIITIDTF